MKYLQIKTLEKGYHDPDHLLLHTCFQILVDYVEKEMDLTNPPADQDEEIIRGLYQWWQKFVEEEKTLEGMLDLDNLRYEEATRQLIRLMSVRKSLWS